MALFGRARTRYPCCHWCKTTRTRCESCQSLLMAAINLQLNYGLRHRLIAALWAMEPLDEPSIPTVAEVVP